MARHRRAEAFEEDEPELNISSLIDICFLLLIYFLVTTTIKKKEQDLQLALPSSAPSPDQTEIQPMFIKIDKSGAIFVNTGPAQEVLDTDVGVQGVPMLSQRLKQYAEGARSTKLQPLVQLYVDGDAKHQRVVDVLNALAKNQIDKVTFTDLLDAETE
jgi:biopolymer transport protein ExbD